MTDEPAQAMVAAFGEPDAASAHDPARVGNRVGTSCAFTKAVEQLGDRWNLVIIRELTIHGTRGFNVLADGIPGISRSVLAV